MSPKLLSERIGDANTTNGQYVLLPHALKEVVAEHALLACVVVVLAVNPASAWVGLVVVGELLVEVFACTETKLYFAFGNHLLFPQTTASRVASFGALVFVASRVSAHEHHGLAGHVVNVVRVLALVLESACGCVIGVNALHFPVVRVAKALVLLFVHRDRKTLARLKLTEKAGVAWLYGFSLQKARALRCLHAFLDVVVAHDASLNITWH